MIKQIPFCNHCQAQLQENQNKVITIKHSFSKEVQSIDFDIHDNKSQPHIKKKEILMLPIHFCDNECFVDFFLGENYLKDVDDE